MLKPEMGMVPDPSEPETKPNVVSKKSQSSIEQVLDPVTIQMQKGEVVPSAQKPKPPWLTKHGKTQ